MKLVLLFLCTLVLIHSHIYSSTSKVTYNYDGKPLIYHLYLSLETGLGASDYLHLIWPQQIHLSSTPTALAADKTKIKAKLISYSNNLVVSQTYVSNDGGISDSNYYVTFGYQMQPNSWYEVQIYPTKDPATIPSSKLLQVRAISSISADAIVYDSNYAFTFINVEKDLSLTGGVATMGIAVSSSSSQQNRPASIYTINIDITPSKGQAKGGNFTLSLYYDSSQPLHNSGTTMLDFSFMGLCQSVSAGPGLSAAVLNFCQISSDLSTITFSMNQVVASQTIRISTQVKNPLYKSIRGIKGYWVEFVSGLVQQNKKVPSAVSVTAIGISNLGNDRIYLLWGIQSTFTDATNIPEGIPLFAAQSSTPYVIPYNSFNIGFSFTQTSPIQGRYKVKITLGSNGILQGSLVHNFPAYQNYTVYCHFQNSPLPGRIECDNVGPFIMTSYRYFISGKTFFNFGTASPISNFGDISIQPVVYDASGSALSVSLYTPLAPGTTINLRTSKSYLDMDGTVSYHDTNDFKIGNAQVISMPDDKTLSSTANAMKSFFTGTNNTVGIVPDLGSSQQLVFLIQTQAADVSGATDLYTMNLLYNNKVIGFQSDDMADTRGLDFVGYENATGNWSISFSPCYQVGQLVCEKYNNDTPSTNVQVRVNSNQAANFYGMYKFNCGKSFSGSVSCPGGSCADECNMFSGYGTSNLGSSVMSMRKVTFPSNYYTSLYADSNLLDFIITFRNNGVVTSSGLINAYTVVGTTLRNIKASYVNYYDYSATKFNKGTRIPMMLRIGGGVLPSQSRNATVIGVFFDDNIEARTFYTSIDKSYQIGCSTGSCLYYPNQNTNNARNDNWLSNKRVEFYNIPPIQNEFNLLVPVTPNPANHALPKFLTIGFFTNNYTLGGVSGLLRTLSVYRLFGAGVNSAMSGVIGSVNSLTTAALSYPDSDFTQTSTDFGSYLSYALNVSNIVSNPPNNTFSYGYSRSSLTFGSTYGAGITITSLYYNIFASSTLAFEKPPVNTSTTCMIFGYTYNEIISPGTNLIRDKQFIYTVFCPIDSALSLNSADANIVFRNPQYPNVFTNGFPLSGILTYAFSNQKGELLDYKYETGSISSFQRSCTTFKSPQYMPSTSGKQRSTFSIVTPQIRMDKNGYDGYPRFKLKFTLPSSTVTATFSLLTACEISDPLLTCVSSSQSPLLQTTYEKYFQISYNGNQIYTITSFSLNLYGLMADTFGTASNYIVTIYLPQYNSQQAPFGHPSASNAYTNNAAYATCQSTFTVGITGRGTQMVFENLNFQSSMQNVRSSMAFDFGAYSYRETFFSTSSFQFNFGFLTNPASTYNSRGDFRCLIYENMNNGSLSLSRAWGTLQSSNLASVILSPKGEIATPSSIKYTMKCYGTGVPVSGSTTNMTLVWKDSTYNVQQATQIAPILYTAPTLTAFTFTIDKKRFRSEGFKAYYTFKIVTGLALSQNARFYLDFHSRINSRLDKQSTVECYTRQNTVIVDSEAAFTYCEFTSQRQLSVWNNLNLAAGDTIYLDIFNIQQPKQSDITTGTQKKISCSIDVDDYYSNGINGYQEVLDNINSLQPMNNAVSKITILSTSVDNSYIRTTQTVTINFDMNTAGVFAAGKVLYLELPFSYSEWIRRSETLTTGSTGNCYLEQTGSGTNLATACVYISKRVLKITVSASAGQLYTLKIKNLKSPSNLPSGRNNQYRFNLFCVTAADESGIGFYTFSDLSSPLTLVNDNSLVDLSWNYYSFAQVSELIQLNLINNQALTIYTGYYSSIVELRQQTYPQNFQTSMTLSLSNYANTDFLSMKDNFKIDLGKSTAYFRIAAKQNLTPGLYSLQFNKAGDTASKYTAIPPLTLVVNNKKCSLVTESNNYLIPVGGSTLPIIIKGLQCIPIGQIAISVGLSSTIISVDNDLSSVKLSKSVIDGNLYIILKHNGGNLPVGSTVTVTFTISGTYAIHYNTIPSITLTVVDPASYQTLPVATSLTAPVLSTNIVSFRLQCSQASVIYWGLGIYPSILNTQALDFQARIISPGAGLTSNFTQSDDYYKRVYGISPVSTMQVLNKTLYNLKSNTNYIFKYFCKNQMGLISDSQSVNFTSLNYGAYLMKIAITFRNSINYGQYHDLSCSLAQSFKIPYERVMTETMSFCNNKPYIFYQNDSSKIANEADSNGEYIYNFYILPDYTIPADTTNVDIRNSLSIHSFTSTIITKTNNYLALPQLVQMQTEDIQVFSTPTISIGSPIAGLNSVVLTASITNMNGFIVIGVMDGTFDNSTMTLPTTNNVKKGLFEENTALLVTKMQYATQNYNITFEFGSLSDNKQFTLLYFATSQDPTFLATSSAVKTVNVKTLQALTVNINWSSALTASLGILLIFLLGM